MKNPNSEKNKSTDNASSQKQKFRQGLRASTPGGLNVIDSIGIVACLSFLSQKMAVSGIPEDASENLIPKVTGDLERWTVALSGVAAETLYLSGLVSSVREDLLSNENIVKHTKSNESSEPTQENEDTQAIGSWSLDLDNIDSSISEYVSYAVNSDSGIEELNKKTFANYEDQLNNLQQSADKFLKVMQELFAEELESLIAKRQDEDKNIDDKEATEDILLAETEYEEGGFNAYGLLGLLGLGGGGGGGGGLLSALGSGAISRLVSGSAIDAYVSGATVWWDEDSDGVLDDGEIYTTTDTDGSYSLDGVGTGGHIVISGGVDIDTGASVSTMKMDVDNISDEGSVTVTPITLLQTYGIDDALIHEILETDTSIDFGSYDPVEIIDSGIGDTVEAARILLHAQQYFALVNALVALAEEQGYEHHAAIELVINSIYEEEDHSNLVGDNGGDLTTLADLITIMFPDYGDTTNTVEDPLTGEQITLSEYAASNIVAVNQVIAEYIPDVDSTEVYVHSDEAKAAALISQDDLVSNFRTIGQLDPFVNVNDIASALSTHRDAASIRTDFLDVYKQNIAQQAAAGGAMITGVDNISIIASNTPTIILASEILSNDTNLGEGSLSLKAVEPLFAPNDYTELVLANSRSDFEANTTSYNGFVNETEISTTSPDGEITTTTDYTYHFDISHVPDVLNGFVKISIDEFVIVMQRTDLSIDLVEQFKEALALAHPMAPQRYEIEVSPTDSDHFYVKHQDGSQINADQDLGTHGPVIKAVGPYVLSDGTDLIVTINDDGNIQVSASESAIEELKLNYIAANDNNQGHGVIKLSLEPTFQEIALSTAADTEIDEDGIISLAGQTDYVETTNSAITENFFVKLDAIQQTGFILYDTDAGGIPIETELVELDNGTYTYPYVQVVNLDTAFIGTPDDFNGDVNLNYKLVSTAGSGKFTSTSEITEQPITFVPVSETGDDAGIIVISDSLEGVETNLASSILSVVENQTDSIAKYFGVSGGDVSETRTIQLSNLPSGITAFVDGVEVTPVGGKISFVAAENDKTEVALTGSESLIQSQFGLFESTKAVIISQETGAIASTGTSVNFSLDIGGEYGLNVSKAVVENPNEGAPVDLGLIVNSIGDSANLKLIIDITSSALSDIKDDLTLGSNNGGTNITFAEFEAVLGSLTNDSGVTESVNIINTSESELLTLDGELTKRFALEFEIAAVGESVAADALSMISSLIIDPTGLDEDGNFKEPGNFKSDLNVSIDVKAIDVAGSELASISNPIVFSHEYQPVADGVTFEVDAADLDFTSGLEDEKLSLLKLFQENTTNLDADEIVYFRLYDLAGLGVSVVDLSGNSLGRVIDSNGTIELSKVDALNAFLSLKADTDLPESTFFVKAFSREPTGEISELVPAGDGEEATLKFFGDADAPILSMDTKVRGLVDDNVPDEFSDKTFVKIPATAALDDTDGSESLFIKVSPTFSDSVNGFVTDFTFTLDDAVVSFSSDSSDANYRYSDDLAYYDNGIDQSFFIVRASELANLQISRPAAEGAYNQIFAVEAVSVERGFESAGVAYTTEISTIEAVKVINGETIINGDSSQIDFAASNPLSLEVEFLQPATKPEFLFTHTDTSTNKFTLDFQNHDTSSTDLVSILVTGATGGASFENSSGITIGAPADVDGVFVFSMDEFFASDGVTPEEITMAGSPLSGVTFQAFSVDQIGITNQSSDSGFTVDFDENSTNATGNLADPIIIDIDGDGLEFNTTAISFDIDDFEDNNGNTKLEQVGWIASNTDDESNPVQNDGFVVMLDVDSNGVPTELEFDGSHLITEYLVGDGTTDAATDLKSISTNGILTLSDLENYTGKNAFLWFDRDLNGLGTASFDELAKITSLKVDLNQYIETNTIQDEVLIAGSTSSGALSGGYTLLDNTGSASSEVGAFTANSSLFDVWLPVVPTTTVTGEMEAISLANDENNSNYYEDYENGFDISSIFSETGKTWEEAFNVQSDELPNNLVVAIRAKHAGTYFKLSDGGILETEPTTTWVLNWDGEPSSDETSELQRLRLFARDNHSGELELEISATALVGTQTKTVTRELSLNIEARADRLEVNVQETASSAVESRELTTVTFDNFSIEKPDIGENVEITIEAADTSSNYPDLTFSLNGVDYILSNGETITLPYPIYAGDLSVSTPAYLSGDFEFLVSAKSIDGLDENVIENIPLNFTVTPTSQGSNISIIDSDVEILESDGLVPVDITITPEDTDGSEQVSSVNLYISEQSDTSDFSSAPIFIGTNGEVSFTAYSDDSFSGYKLELESDFYSFSDLNGVQVVTISGSIKTPQYFDGDLTVSAETVTAEISDAAASSENESSQTFVVQGVTDGIAADDFVVSGTSIYGSEAVLLSSIISSATLNDTDEDIFLTLSLSTLFEGNDNSGFYDNVSQTYLSSPLTINAVADNTNSSEQNLLSRLSEIEIRTADSQNDFSIIANISSRDGNDDASATVSKEMFVASIPLSNPEIVNSAGGDVDTTFTLTEGGLTQFDIAASLNGVINPDNVTINFSGLPNGFQVTPIGGVALTDTEGVFSIIASELTQGVVIGPDPDNSAASNYFVETFNFEVSATASYPVGSDKTSSSSISVEMLPSLDGVEFQTELQVNGNEFTIFDLVTLNDAFNEKLSEVSIQQNGFLEVRLAGKLEYISFNDADLILSEADMISGDDIVSFRKSGNYVGTSDIIIDAISVDQSATNSIGGLQQTSSINLEFNTDADLIQLFEDEDSTDILDKSVINDGRTDTGSNVTLNISIGEFSSVLSSDTVGVSISGSGIVDGTEIVKSDGTVFASQEIGSSGSFQIFIPSTNNTFSAIDKATINIPKTDLGFGSRTISAQAIISGKSSISLNSSETETFLVESDSPPVAQVGFNFNLTESELTSAAFQDDGIFVTDLVRIPQINTGHFLELVALPENTVVGFEKGSDFIAVSEDNSFEIFSNDSSENIAGYRFSSSELETATIKLSSDVALGSKDLTFKTRVGIADGVMDNGDTRYVYSRFVDFTTNLGTYHGVENDFILENTVSDVNAGAGDDIIVPIENSIGSIDGGTGNDSLVLTNIAGINGGAIVDLNQNKLYATASSSTNLGNGSTSRDLNSIENVIGTPGDDTLVANGNSSTNTTLIGSEGDDYLVGGAGNDVLAGGQGEDILAGGVGEDKYIIAVSDEDGKRDAGTDSLTNFEISDKIVLTGFEITKSVDGSLPAEVSVTRNTSSGFYEVSVEKTSGDNLLSALIIIEDISNLSTDETVAIQQITDSIMFDELIDTNSVDPFNSNFEFPFDTSVIDLVSSSSVREEFFGDHFEYDDIGNALGIIADAKFDIAYKSQLGALKINDSEAENSINMVGDYTGLAGSKNDDTLIAKDSDSVLYGGDGGNDRLVGGSGDDTLIATSSTDSAEEDYLRGGSGSDNFVMINPSEINETLQKIYQVRIEDFNRIEGDRVTLLGYDNHEISISEVDENNTQTAQITNLDDTNDSLTIYFDLSIMRDFDAAFNLRMADFDKVDS